MDILPSYCETFSNILHSQRQNAAYLFLKHRSVLFLWCSEFAQFNPFTLTLFYIYTGLFCLTFALFRIILHLIWPYCTVGQRQTQYRFLYSSCTYFGIVNKADFDFDFARSCWLWLRPLATAIQVPTSNVLNVTWRDDVTHTINTNDERLNLAV